MRKGGTILPDFIIIGAMKCGTTTLYRYLSEHPEIGMSREKETDFFVAEKSAGRGLDWYQAQFDADRKLHGEASPNYTKCRDFPGVPERMAQVLPEAKLIYILRDPVKRAESQYRHSFLIGDIAAQDISGSHEYQHILDASMYARQLNAFRAYYPDDQILVLDFDELVRDPQSVMDRICAFIGAAPMALSDSGAQNNSSELSRIPAPILKFVQSRAGQTIAGLVSRDMRDRVRRLLARGKARQAPPFSDELRSQIRDDLRNDMAELRALTGQRFDGWSI